MTNAHSLYAGFDLGGTKISMTLADRSGEVVRREKLKAPSNISTAGGMSVAGNVINLIARSGFLPDIAAMTFAIAGYSNKSELYDFEQTLRTEFSNVKSLNFMPDYKIFLHSDWSDFSIEKENGGDDAVKAIIICGTGSVVMVCARNESGAYEVHKIFGGGPLISDPGSGFDLGLRFLRRYGIEHALGALDDRVYGIVRAGGYEDIADIAEETRLTGPGAAAKIAAFAPLMLEISENVEGTPYFEDTLAAARNVAMGMRHIFKNNLKNPIDKPVKILFNGSVLLRSEFYRNIMKEYLKSFINAPKIDFFEVTEDVSLICAKYSIEICPED